MLRFAFSYLLGREKKIHSFLETHTRIHIYISLHINMHVKYFFHYFFFIPTNHKKLHKITINNFLEWFLKFFILNILLRNTENYSKKDSKKQIYFLLNVSSSWVISLSYVNGNCGIIFIFICFIRKITLKKQT